MLGSLTVLTLVPSLSGGLMFITVMPRQLSKPLSWNRTKFVRSYLKPVSRLIKLHKKMKPFPRDELDDKIAGEAGVHEYVVSTGDTLSSILNQYGIDMGDITQLAAVDKELRNLKIGQQLSPDINRGRRTAAPHLGSVSS